MNDITLITKSLEFCDKKGINRLNFKSAHKHELAEILNLKTTKLDYIKKILCSGSDEGIQSILHGSSSIWSVYTELNNPQKKRSAREFYDILVERLSRLDSSRNNNDHHRDCYYVALKEHVKIFYKLKKANLLLDSEYDHYLSVLKNRLEELYRGYIDKMKANLLDYDIVLKQPGNKIILKKVV